MKKISFFVGSMGRGGAERVISILTKHYCEKGWRVDIVMLLHNSCEYPLDERVCVVDLSHKTDSKKPFRIIHILRSVRSYIHRDKPDIIVPFLTKIGALVELALFYYGKRNFRIVTSERIDPYSVDYPSILRFIIRRALHSADAVVFQTKRAQSYYNKLIQDKSYIIGNPVSIELTRITNPSHIIINAGRLVPQKNQNMLIEAFSIIANKYPDYALHIYGEGELREELEKQVTKLELQERVFLPGNRLDYQERLAETDLFILSSDYEGLSNALLEAMMLGLPCISTDCAGSDEILINKENGLLTPVGDAILLANAMECMLQDEHLRQRLGKSAMETAQKFKTENVIVAWEEALEGDIYE